MVLHTFLGVVFYRTEFKCWLSPTNLQRIYTVQAEKLKGSVSRDWDGSNLVSEERSWEARGARIFYNVCRRTCAKLRAFIVPQRCLFGLRIWLKHFGRPPTNFRRSSEAGKNWGAVFRRPLIKRVFLCALRKTANKFVGGLPKPESNLTCIL